MPTTLKDVAAHADVSTKTVSNVVHGNLARVSPETANRVRESLAALNYRPNLAARYLRNGHVGALALVVPDLCNPYFASLCTAVIEAATEQGYSVLVDHTGGDWTRERLAFRGLRPHLIDGVILSPLSLGREDMQLQDTEVPVVLLGERLYDAPYDHVAIDNVAAARVATSHLLSLGRRRVAAVGFQEDHQNGVARLRRLGYEEALREAGHAVDPDLVALIDPPSLWASRSDGARAVHRLLALACPPDALFCFNDLLALGAMKALHLAGRRVPEDVAVIGFDNLEEGLFATPSLTTIAPDMNQLARSAVSMVIARIRGTPRDRPQFAQPPFRLIVRGSTGGPEPGEELSFLQAPRAETLVPTS